MDNENMEESCTQAIQFKLSSSDYEYISRNLFQRIISNKKFRKMICQEEENNDDIEIESALDEVLEEIDQVDNITEPIETMNNGDNEDNNKIEELMKENEKTKEKPIINNDDNEQTVEEPVKVNNSKWNRFNLLTTMAMTGMGFVILKKISSR
jgi:hypothetical protein